MRVTPEVAAERESYIVELIKESGTNGLSAKEIEKDCKMTSQQRSVLMTRIKKKHPEIDRVGKPSESPTYVWAVKPRETHSPFLKNRYEKTNKNHEGYTDMTATTAINNVSASDTRDWIKPEPGEIWVNEESNGKNGYIFVLGFDGMAASCVKLFDIADAAAPQAIDHAIRIKLGAITYIGDCGRPTYKYKKYLVRRARGNKDEDLMKVRKEVASALGIEAFRIKEVEVPGPERIVEKVVYRDKEPEKVPDGYISKIEAELYDYKHQAEIWRAAFYGVVKRDRTDAKNS